MGVAITDIYDLLYRLGAAANRTGFFYTAYAVLLSVECQERLLLAADWLYPKVAKRYNTGKETVELEITGTIDLIWKENPELLSEMAGKVLTERPCTARFIAILSASLLRGEAA